MRLAAALAVVLLACTGTKRDERLPELALQEETRITTLSDSAAAGVDLEVGVGGTMFLLVRSDRQIRVFGPAGNLINVIAGGAEPFKTPTRLGTVWGYLTVYDSTERRVSVLRANGTVVQTMQLAQREPGSTTRRTFELLAPDTSIIVREVDADGRAWLLKATGAGTKKIADLGAINTPVLFAARDRMLVVVDSPAATRDSAAVSVAKLTLAGDTVFSTVWRTARHRDQPGGASAAFVVPSGNIYVRYGEGGKRVRWVAFDFLGRPLFHFDGPANVRFIGAGNESLYGLRESDGQFDLVRYFLTRADTTQT